jgi:UDP-N-acetylglucosamine 2-epimerase (non-hydrolysing)
MSAAVNPYGDGHASERIAAALAGRPYSPFEAPAPRFALA